MVVQWRPIGWCVVHARFSPRARCKPRWRSAAFDAMVVLRPGSRALDRSTGTGSGICQRLLLLGNVAEPSHPIWQRRCCIAVCGSNLENRRNTSLDARGASPKPLTETSFSVPPMPFATRRSAAQQSGQWGIEKWAVKCVACSAVPCATHRRCGLDQQQRRICAVPGEAGQAENRPQSHQCAGEPEGRRQRFQQPLDKCDCMLVRPDRTAQASERPDGSIRNVEARLVR